MGGHSSVRVLRCRQLNILVPSNPNCDCRLLLTSLVDGGTAGLIWGFLAVSIGFLFVYLSLAEMASMAPTAGGQYHWVSEFAPRSAQKFLSFIVGMANAGNQYSLPQLIKTYRLAMLHRMAVRHRSHRFPASNNHPGIIGPESPYLRLRTLAWNVDPDRHRFLFNLLQYLSSQEIAHD